jgi:thioredoxin-like negative regulator of GroEL
MSIDVYQPCPCGSGKKIKFCCQSIVDEMSRFAKLQQSNQPAMAMQVLEKLEQEQPNNPWVVTTHASVLLGSHDAEQAKELLEGLREAHPDHPMGLVLYATARFATQGYAGAKNDIHRAFQKSMAGFPDLVSGLAMGVAGTMYASGKHMAAREHLVLSMRLAPEKQQQGIFLRLLEFDGDARVPYPLRSIHELAEYSGDEENEKDAAKAARFSGIGCWGPAATVFSQVAERDPENAALWQNIGLCRAWDGDETRAAEALHKAAVLTDDFETAVELETIAQLLDYNITEDRVRVRSISWEIESASQMLTVLDGHDRLPRIEIAPDAEENDPREMPAGYFEVVDRAVDVSEKLTIENIPRVSAQLTVYDADTDEEVAARVHLTGFDDESLEEASKLVEEIAGDHLKPFEDLDDDEMGIESVPGEWFPMQWRWYVPPKTNGGVRRDLEQAQWRTCLEDVWPNLSMAALGGKSPTEAASDPEAKVKLAAAVYVLDALTGRDGYSLDGAPVRRRLNLDDPQPIELTDETPLNSFTVLQTNRLSAEKLSDEQLAYVLNRALLVHYGRFLYTVLAEVLKRPSCLENVDLNRVYGTLADLCLQRYERETAFEWIAKAREHVKTLEGAFEAGLQWSMRELMLRVDQPDDPELPALVDHVWNFYGKKLPQLREHLTNLFETYGIEPPAAGSVVAGSEGGLWTPGDAEPAEGEGEKKLWVPGQR